jgi:spermidine synthase
MPVARWPPVPLLVFVVGCATLGAEIAAARLLAPFFGDSTIIWANTIGVVLVALSAGYWVGGRLADRDPAPAALCRLVMVAAVLLAAVPIAADPMLSWSVKAFDDISVGGFAGSLAGVLVLVAVPVLLLGAVSPWAIRLSLKTVEDSGRTTGRMYAIGTFGSLAGTFTASLLLIPLLGTQRTFLVYALALALVAAPGLRARWLAGPAAVAALLALPIGTIKGDAGEGRVVEERETTYQYARVLEYPDGTRRMELNEGQAVHSVWRPGTVLTGDYWDGYLVLPFSVRSSPPRDVAMLGVAGGTVATAYARYLPSTRIDAVEIDGRLLEMGRRWLGLRDRPQLHTHTEDARPFLRRTERRYDAIFVDAYRQPYIPFYLTTREFFSLARSRLAPGGSVIVNVGHPEGDDRLERVLTATLRDVFGHVARDPMRPTNSLVVASDTPPAASRMTAGVTSAAPALGGLAAGSARRLAPGLDGGAVYTDDHAPVEWLVDGSLIDYARER